ncbi:MAG TPA: DNA polymerase III subunit delta' [Rhizomicrobium sp.]|jgi:DNA polymerase-3 subunit delta'|nr:DNA polymerase III subunit delta' [Rhizomicrobium sp.]
MAKRARSEDIEETDCIEGFPHPRETFRLSGQDEALARAAHAIRSGRPPQAWLITGPAGIGKATLAYRIARYLLRYGATDAGPADLSVAPNDPVSLQVTAGAHPGLLLLKRGPHPDTGRMMTVLAVHVVRRLVGFFGMTSGAGGWRVAIIDTADEMNDAAANALLKALEEPPARSMLMLLSNAPGKLLPTIRSRCQRLDLRPLPEDVLAAELAQHLPKMSEADRVALTKLAGGSVGAALTLADEDTLALARDAARAVDDAAVPNVPALFALADRVGRAADRLPLFGGFLIQALEERICKRAQAEGTAGLRRWIEAWEQARANFDRATGLHLEPRQTIVSSIRAIQSASPR